MATEPDAGTWTWIVSVMAAAVSAMAGWIAYMWRSDRERTDTREERLVDLIKENTAATQKSADASDRVADAMDRLSGEVRSAFHK